MGLDAWDARLITPEQALRLAGDWPVYTDWQFAKASQFEPEGGGERQQDHWQVNLRCARDGQSVALLASPPGHTLTTTGDLLSAILRHLVTAHDQPLSGAKDGQ